MHVQSTKHTFYSTHYETMFLDQESMLIKMTWIRFRIENFEIVDSDLCPPILRPRPKEDKIFGGTTWIRVLICSEQNSRIRIRPVQSQIENNMWLCVFCAVSVLFHS
jgi:hypothetical protein